MIAAQMTDAQVKRSGLTGCEVRIRFIVMSFWVLGPVIREEV